MLGKPTASRGKTKEGPLYETRNLYLAYYVCYPLVACAKSPPSTFRSILLCSSAPVRASALLNMCLRIYLLYDIRYISLEGLNK